MARPVNKHHRFYPRSMYKRAGGIAWAFYQLPCNIIETPVELHDAYHACHSSRSILPPYEFMERRVEMYRMGACGCTHHAPAVVDLETERRRRRG